MEKNGVVVEDGANGADGPTAEERAVAVADVTCKEDSQLVHVYRKALWEAEVAEMARNAPIVDAMRRRVQEEVRAANALLATLE